LGATKWLKERRIAVLSKRFVLHEEIVELYRKLYAGSPIKWSSKILDGLNCNQIPEFAKMIHVRVFHWANDIEISDKKPITQFAIQNMTFNSSPMNDTPPISSFEESPIIESKVIVKYIK